MSEWPEVPNFGLALAEHISGVPDEGRPAFLAGLERSAAARYRAWADAMPEGAETLLACAEREDEIARLVSEQFAPSADVQTAVDAALPAAIDTYYEIFAAFTVREQLYLQSEAELQGAQAWVGIAADVEDPMTLGILTRCSSLEEESSRAVKRLLDATA